MKTLQLNEDFYWIGTQDPDLRVFDIIMETKYGTTYNSYVLKTKAGVVLFESVKERFFDEYVEKIKEITSLEDITHIVCEHTEPDHSGSIAKLLAINPKIVVVSSFIANMYLKEIINHDFPSMIVKDQDVLDLQNKKIRFLSAPNLHWPDSMYSYIEEDHTLVTCDSFGAHYSHEEVLLSRVTDKAAYEDAFAYYTTMIMGPFKKFVVQAIKKIESLQIDLIAPGHGPVIDCEIHQTIEKYENFCIDKVSEQKKVVIPYVSAYGYTEKMAKTIKQVLENHQIECHMYDLVVANMDEVVEDMIRADGLLYGCPTLLNDALPPIYQVMNSMLSAYHGSKVASAFGSYGWSGEAVPNLIARLKQQKMSVHDEGLRIKFNPSEAQLKEVEAFTLAFMEHLS